MRFRYLSHFRKSPIYTAEPDLLCIRAVKALASLCTCASSSWLPLVDSAISTIAPRACSNKDMHICLCDIIIK